jgi:K+-transporting ATPase ATPase B chain
MSGVDLDGRSIRKGAADAIAPSSAGAAFPREVARAVDRVAGRAARRSSSPRRARVLGVVEAEGHRQGRHRERFAELRRMGIRTVMITGDNPLTAAAIAAEAGVDDFLAEATPEAKLALIRDEQARGTSSR